MHRHLYFICPTDHIETEINRTFKGENYFITSLGNSIAFNEKNLSDIVELLCSECVKNISFVLCLDNQIVLDVLNEHSMDSNDLSEFRSMIRSQKEYSQAMWQNHDERTFAISYYLNSKVKSLRSELNHHLADIPKINALFHDKSGNSFRSVSPGLIYENSISVN